MNPITNQNSSFTHDHALTYPQNNSKLHSSISLLFRCPGVLLPTWVPTCLHHHMLTVIRTCPTRNCHQRQPSEFSFLLPHHCRNRPKMSSVPPNAVQLFASSIVSLPERNTCVEQNCTCLGYFIFT